MNQLKTRSEGWDSQRCDVETNCIVERDVHGVPLSKQGKKMNLNIIEEKTRKSK